MNDAVEFAFLFEVADVIVKRFDLVIFLVHVLFRKLKK